MQLKRLLLLLLLASSAKATTFTVKAGGGGSFTTIQACATAMANGDTCTVFAGTYAEDVTVGAGGVGSYRTMTVNGSDVVFVHSFTITSHDKITGNCPVPSTQGTCGFSIQNPSSPTNAPCVSVSSNSTDYFITNNNLYACGTYMIKEQATSSNTTHAYIQGNTFSYSCSTSSAPNVCQLMSITGDYHLIENNDISHVSDGPELVGAHNIMRKNTFHNTIDTDCGSNSSNCHIDFMQADASVTGGALPATFLLLEGNTITNMVTTGTGDAHGIGLFQAENCSGQCNNAIVRFNSVSHINGGAIVDDNSFAAVPPQAWINVKSYNNSWVDMGHGVNNNFGITNAFDHGSTGGASINELFYYAQTLSDFNPYECQDANGNACTGPIAFSFGHNLGFCTTDGVTLASPCLLRSHVYGTGSWTSDSGNIVSNPLFVNYSANNFNLQAASPAIGAGTNLTTAVGTGTGSTALTVADAGYFQDNPGSIVGVQADWIRIGASTAVQIASINYSTNVITLASPQTWSNGAAIYLYKDSSGNQQLFGASPNIGAFQTGAPAPSPVMFTAVPLPAAGPVPVISSIVPTQSYVTAKGCSQDGKTWNVNCPVRLMCGGCAATTAATLDGKTVTASFKTGELDVNIPLAMLPIPTVATQHVFALSNPANAPPVIQ